MKCRLFTEKNCKYCAVTLCDEREEDFEAGAEWQKSQSDLTVGDIMLIQQAQEEVNNNYVWSSSTDYAMKVLQIYNKLKNKAEGNALMFSKPQK